MTFSSALRFGFLTALLTLLSTLSLSAESVTSAANPPMPKDRPKLSTTDLLGKNNRLEVHGGAALTIGGGSGTGYRAYSGWTTFHDPVTGITLGAGYTRSSGHGVGQGCLNVYDDAFGCASAFPGDLTQDGHFASTRSRLHPYHGRWHSQSTDLMLQLPLLGVKNFLTLNVSKETLRTNP